MANIPKGLSREEYDEWLNFTASISGPQPPDKLNDSIMRSVTGILGRNQRLGRKIEDLRSEISRLNDLAQTHSGLRGNKNARTFIENLDFSLFARSFSHQILRWDNKPPNSGWYLQLNFPEDDKNSDTILEETVSQCNFHFVVPQGETPHTNLNFLSHFVWVSRLGVDYVIRYHEGSDSLQKGKWEAHFGQSGRSANGYAMH